MTNEERQAWLADRKTGIGATDASAIAGVSPWRSPMDVFLSKLTDHENEPSFRMELGLMLEPVVAQLYANETGYELVKPPKLVRHPERDWQIASLDYWLKDRTRNVELKTTDSQNIGEWGEPGTDEVPEVYLVQIMHQMVVSRIPVTDIGVLFGTKEFRIYTVEYNEALGEQLTIMEQEFWHENILKSIPPSVDWTDPRTAKLIQSLYKPVGGQVQLSWEEVAMVKEYKELADAAKDAKDHQDVIKAKLAERMGTAVEGLLPDGMIVSRKMVDRAGYEVKPCTYCDFRIKKGSSGRK